MGADGAGEREANQLAKAEMGEYYTAEQACAVLGVKIATLYSYVNRGLLKSYRQHVGRQRLYSRREVDALLEISVANDAESEIPAADTWTREH